MPFPFILPTTSSFSFSAHFESSSHPSLPLTASTHRGVLRSVLKSHKRLPAAAQASNLPTVIQALESYIPHLLAIDAGLAAQPIAGEEVDVVLTSTPVLEWRPVLSAPHVPGRDALRTKLSSLEYEILSVLSTLAYAYTLLARSALHPLYLTLTSSPTPTQRTSAIQTATKHLLAAASIHAHLAPRADSLPSPAPSPDLAPTTARALAALALADATLLAVLKDDPYPAAVAQERNQNDRDWMIKAPDMPKVRAHLFARLCLAAVGHAAQAAAMLGASASKGGKIDEALMRYADDTRRVGRAKACRFFGIDADLGGETGIAIAWARGGLAELGLSPTMSDESKSSGGLKSKLKTTFLEKRESKRVSRDEAWGSDAGKAEEGRVLSMLEKKWSRENDAVNTQLVPAASGLLAGMPSGREVYTVKSWVPLMLGAGELSALRGPPDREKERGMEGGLDSSDEEERGIGGRTVPGGFPDTDQPSEGGRAYY